MLQATDRRKVTFLDVLIECDQKMVVSNAAVSVIIIVTTIGNNDSTNKKMAIWGFLRKSRFYT